MTAVRAWHASPRRVATAARDDRTGEVRLPLSLFCVDQPQGDVDLVLSRTEAVTIHATLTRLLDALPHHLTPQLQLGGRP